MLETSLWASDRAGCCAAATRSSASRIADRCTAGRFSKRCGAQSPASYHFGEGIAEAIEQCVSGEKHADRCDPERQQPLPVADRPVKQDLLIRNGQVCKRVQIEEQLEAAHVLLKPGVDDRGGEQPEHQDACQNNPTLADV